MIMENDPLDGLYLPVLPIQPRSGFAASLRQRIQDSLEAETNRLAETKGEQDMHDQPVTRSVTFALHYRDVTAAVQWLGDVIGLTTVSAYPTDGPTQYATLGWGTEHVSVNYKHGLYEAMGPTFVTLHVGSADELDQIYDRVQARGGQIAQAKEANWDHRSQHFIARDPEGHLWELSGPNASS